MLVQMSFKYPLSQLSLKIYLPHPPVCHLPPAAPNCIVVELEQGWKKLLLRRTHGIKQGKWDIALVP